MRQFLALPLVAAILLSACGGSEETPADSNADGAISAAEVAAEAGNAVKPQPGQYTSTVELLEFEVPGAPANMNEQLKAAFAGGASQGNSFCMTEADSDPKKMLENMAESDCTFSQFDVTSGTIKAVMACQTPQGPAQVQMDGTMTSDSSTMTMAMTQAVAGAGEVRMKMRVASKRTGECS